jgi:hypothetical protein
MANDDHIAQLKKGVAAWNAWRDENPEILPNLREADLSGADLSLTNLVETDLTDADPTCPRSINFASSSLPAV